MSNNLIDSKLYTYEMYDTFDLSILEKTLNDIKRNSFHFLYQLQKELLLHYRFDFHISDLKKASYFNHSVKVYPRKYVYYVDVNFIDEKNRIKYKQSPFYNKELSIFDTADNPDIFTHTYMVFVDGRFYDTINILPMEDKTAIIFDIYEKKTNPTGITKEHFEELLAHDSPVTVLFIPNCTYGIYNTNRHVLELYKDNLSLQRFNLSSNLSDDNKYITFVNENDLLFSSVIVDTDNSSDMLRFYNQPLNEKTKYVHINIFGFRNLYDQIYLDGSEKFFRIPLQAMPIPIENIIIFRDKDGKKYFAHDIRLKLYYPNVYEVIGNDNNDNLVLYVFYSDDTKNIDILSYKNHLELFHSLFGTGVEEYQNDTIFKIVRDYFPPVYNYDIKDFENSEWYPNHLDYKIETFRKWISENSDNLRYYLYNQVKTPRGYYLDISEVNLESKLRLDNFSEIEDEELQEKFDTPRYLFIIPNRQEDNSHFRFFIDGFFYVPDKVYRKGSYDYYYIPVELINKDSVIEIEKFDNTNLSKDIKFTNLDEKILIDLYNGQYFSINDIFLVEKNTGNYIKREDYDFIVIRDGAVITLPTSSFKPIKENFYIKLKNESLLNVDITLYIKRTDFFIREKVTERIDRTKPYVLRNITIAPDRRNFRVFINSRFTGMNHYDVFFMDRVTDPVTVQTNILRNFGDEVVIDYTPHKYKVIYTADTIHEKGFVDLRGIINKPFGLKWYDIFLNGQKLNKKHIEIISPFLIMIKNVSTRRNLIIIERDRSGEFFKATEPNTINDKLWDTVKEFRDRILDRDSIKDTDIDIVTEIISDLEIETMRFFFLYLTDLGFINPDLKQMVEYDKKYYPAITAVDPILINPDIRSDALSESKIFPKV